MSQGLLERHLSQVWQAQWFDAAGLAAADGQTVSILHPGRANTDDRGPDFRDAVIRLGGRPVSGDIEIHQSTGDWRAHGHERDPAYNRVVLHVVLRHDGGAPTRCSNGVEVPVLALGGHLRAPASVWWGDGGGLPSGAGAPCRGVAGRVGSQNVVSLLERAGEARFMRKAAAFGQDLKQSGAEEALYRGIMRALGYARNTGAFLELARRLPLRRLAAVTDQAAGAPVGECAARLHAAFLDAAGLAAARRRGWGGGAAPAIEATEQPPMAPGLPAVSGGEWHLFRIRPNNSPARRLAAMSHLLARYRQGGLLAGIMGAVGQAPIGRANRWLEGALLVPGLGAARAADIVVNVVLPFSRAVGDADGRDRLRRQALALYRGYGRTAPNAVTRHMAMQFGMTPAGAALACRQQGLLHIYRTLCTEGACGTCPLAAA